MAFNVGQGLSLMGTAIAKTAGDWIGESHRAELQREAMVLADQLAGAREEKGRQFQTSERVESQKYQSGEKSADRAHGEKLALLQADTAIKTAGIGAGATLTAAQMRSADAAAERKQRGEQFDKEFAAKQPIIDADVLAKTIRTASEKNVLDARKELDEATTSGDQAKIAAAKQKVYNAEYSSKDEVQQVSLYQAQARLIEQQLTAAQARLVALQNNDMTSMTPEGKAAIEKMQAYVTRLERDFTAATSTAQAALKRLPQYGAAVTGTPDLSKYLKVPGGLINQPAP